VTKIFGIKKGQVVPAHTMKAYSGSICTDFLS